MRSARPRPAATPSSSWRCRYPWTTPTRPPCAAASRSAAASCVCGRTCRRSQPPAGASTSRKRACPSSAVPRERWAAMWPSTGACSPMGRCASSPRAPPPPKACAAAATWRARRSPAWRLLSAGKRRIDWPSTCCAARPICWSPATWSAWQATCPRRSRNQLKRRCHCAFSCRPWPTPAARRATPCASIWAACCRSSICVTCRVTARACCAAAWACWSPRRKAHRVWRPCSIWARSMSWLGSV